MHSRKTLRSLPHMDKHKLQQHRLDTEGKRKNGNMWRPNNRLLNKSKQKKNESLKKSRRKLKNSLREMKIETKLCLWDAANVILGEKFIMNQAYLKKQF